MTSVREIISPVSVRKVQALSNDGTFLEKICRNFMFMEGLKMEGNLVRLVQMLSEALQLQQTEVKLLGEFLVDANLPIEVTLRPLKAKQLSNLLQEWLDYPAQDLTQTCSQKYVTFRNALFKNVLSGQQQTIRRFFLFSQKNGLTHDSIFNLFQQMLANYFLYDSSADNQTYFKKENSFLGFKTLVQEFCSRRSSERNTKQIYQHQLEHLIAFWEQSNPDLTLSDTPRKFMGNTSVQTEQMSKLDHQVQTVMPQLTLVDILNSTLIKLNLSIAECASPKDLQAIERMYAFFEHQKTTFLNQKQPIVSKFSEISQTRPLEMTEKSKTASLPKKSVELHADPYPRCTTFTPRYTSNQKWNNQKKLTTSKHSTAVSNYTFYQIQYASQSSINPFEDSIKTIYMHYYSEEGKFTLATLNDFLRDIGTRQMGELTTRLKDKGILRNPSHISYEQFKGYIQRIISNSPSFNKLLIQQFSKSIERIRRQSSRQGRSSTMAYHNIHNR